MTITLTLFAQIITFVILMWFVKSVLWEPMINMLEARKQKISEGLAAAEKGRHEQELAEKKALEEIKKAKQEAAEIISLAQKRASDLVDEARHSASEEGLRIKKAAEADMEQEINRARESLRSKVAELALLGAGKILEKEIDLSAHKQELDKLISQL